MTSEDLEAQPDILRRALVGLASMANRMREYGIADDTTSLTTIASLVPRLPNMEALRKSRHSGHFHASLRTIGKLLEQTNNLSKSVSYGFYSSADTVLPLFTWLTKVRCTGARNSRDIMMIAKTELEPHIQ